MHTSSRGFRSQTVDKGEEKKLQQNSVAEFASSKGIPLLQPEKPNAALADWLCAQNRARFRYGLQALPAGGSAGGTKRMACSNFHGSILPSYRGASPVEAAIALGEVETGVSLMQVVKEEWTQERLQTTSAYLLKMWTQV